MLVGIGNKFITSLIRLNPSLLYLLFGRRIFLSSTLFWKSAMPRKVFGQFLGAWMHWLFGWTLENIAEEDKGQLFSRLYTFTSVKMLVHWFQVIQAGRFQMFEECLGPGTVSGRGSGHPAPRVPLDQIRTPLALIVGGRDTLCDEEYLVERVSLRIVGAERLPDYEHLDFIWADDVPKRITRPILALLANLRPRPKKQ